MGKIAEDHGVKVGIEMVPNNMVYTPETLMRLREAVGPVGPDGLSAVGASVRVAGVHR